MWTRESLLELVQVKLKDYPFIVVSNREPYIHSYSARSIMVQKPASGLTVALDPVMQACGGTWVAHGSGDADRDVVDIDNKVRVPAEDPKYSLRRVWLSKEDEAGYYYGFANESLWPVCHIAYTRPLFSEVHWNAYRRVNSMFADSVLAEVGGRKAFVFVQDYHLALLPRILKAANPNLIVAQFWHIPWPNPEAFRICPWQEEILKGMLGNDMMAFHIRYHCNNFLDTVDRALECRIDRERVEITHSGKKTAVRAFPISVDFDELDRQSRSKQVDEEIARLKKRLAISDQIVGIGLDRIDYTKGIPERFKALDRFFTEYPEFSKRMIFVQAGVPSRTQVGAYQHLNEEIQDLVESINARHRDGDWQPILFLREHESQLTLLALRRMAHFCIVSSLHDGMNLVAKEFPASRFDEDGVLILSRFTGAARELPDALLINPYATDDFAQRIKEAVDMPREERRKRMVRMRETVKENNIYKWAADVINELVRIEFGG
jgi:alpha,alpha-trehalose-phosphate synthase [UDP-forming]